MHDVKKQDVHDYDAAMSTTVRTVISKSDFYLYEFKQILIFGYYNSDIFRKHCPNLMSAKYIHNNCENKHVLLTGEGMRVPSTTLHRYRIIGYRRRGRVADRQTVVT